MAMSLEDYNKLKKFMAMTTSEADQEVLMAIRGANKLLTGYQLDWEKVFGRVVKVIEGSEPERSEEPGDLEHEFHDAIENSSGGFLQMLEDIYEQWQKTGRISPKQEKVVRDAAARARRR